MARYLDQVRQVAGVGWKSGVEVAKQLPDLYEAPDERLAEAYVEIVADATKGPPEDTETAQLAAELGHLERELREMEPKVKRAQELKSLLAARDRRDEKRRKHAVELAAALPRSWPACARATARPTSARCAPWPRWIPRPPWRRPTPCSTSSTGSGSPPRARPSGWPAASRCWSATRRSGAATSASGASTPCRSSRS